jgi:glutamine amidotransferase
MSLRQVHIVDYGMGNLLSVARAVAAVGGEPILVEHPEDLAAASLLILPGVGAFGAAMGELSSRGLIEPIKAHCRSGRPFLGICLGMQLMLEESEEFGAHGGLGLIPGAVRAIPCKSLDGTSRKIPHIGWNRLISPSPERWKNTLLKEANADFAMYFVHSFSVKPRDPADLLASVDYDGISLTAAIARDNMTGFQGHPEKSGPKGLRILQNFLDRP